MTATERDELARLRRENRQLRQEKGHIGKGSFIEGAIGSSPMDDAWFAAAPNGRTN